MNPSEKHFFLQFQYVPYRLCCSCIVSSRSLCLSLCVPSLFMCCDCPCFCSCYILLRINLHTVWKFCENLRVWNFSECCFVSYFACDKWRVLLECAYPFALCCVRHAYTCDATARFHCIVSSDCIVATRDSPFAFRLVLALVRSAIWTDSGEIASRIYTYNSAFIFFLFYSSVVMSHVFENTKAKITKPCMCVSSFI